MESGYFFINEGESGASVFYVSCGSESYTSVAVNPSQIVRRCCNIGGGDYPYTNDVAVTIDLCSTATDCTTNSDCIGCS